MNRYSILYLLSGTRGGVNRAHILAQLEHAPLNAHQLKERLGLDYKTIQHHLRLLIKNKFIIADHERYGARYCWTPQLRAHTLVVHEIMAKINKSSDGA